MASTKERFIKLEKYLRETYVPDLNHHSYENLLKPKENMLQVLRGEKIVRTIKEEDIEVLWYAGIKTLEELAEKVLVRERKELKNV